MLFDLRSPHRRRVIKIVYVFLALLIGVGLVGFGIGNGSNFGGLFSNAGGGGGSANGAKLYTNALAKAEQAANAAPGKAALWVKAGEAAYSVATLQDVNYSASAGYTVAGHVALNKLRAAWNHYLADAPANPDPFFAQEVVAGFGLPPAEGGTGVGDYKTTESAQAILTESQPTDSQYELLALYSWLAGDTSSGDQAAAKARTLAPKKDLATVNHTLAEYKSLVGLINPASATGATSTSGTTSTPSTSTSASTSS
jgi:hypothetical protein